MSDRPAFITISIPPVLRERVDERLDGSDFGNMSEYVRDLIRADLDRLDYEKLIKRRLAMADQGGPFIRQEEAEAYLAAKVNGQNPAFPRGEYHREQPDGAHEPSSFDKV